MKACVLLSPERLICKDIPKPVINQNEVLVKVMACGICGSDLKYLKGENPWALHTLGEHRDNPPNMVLGHEFAGIVCEVGHEKYARLLNKRVAVEPYNTCGACEFCRTGRYNLCKDTIHIGHGAGWGEMEYYPGGMAQYCKSWATHVYELPDNISFVDAVVLDPLAVAVHAVSVSNFKPGMRALVMGAGPVGLCISSVLKAHGCDCVFITDIVENLLKFADRHGAGIVLNSLSCNIVKEVMSSTGGLGVNRIFDTVGKKETLNDGMRCLCESGVFVSLVAGKNPVNFSLSMLSGERSVTVSANNLYDDFLEAIRLMNTGKIDFGKMVTHTYGIDNVKTAFDTVINKDVTNAVKVAILPWE